MLSSQNGEREMLETRVVGEFHSGASSSHAPAYTGTGVCEEVHAGPPPPHVEAVITEEDFLHRRMESEKRDAASDHDITGDVISFCAEFSLCKGGDFMIMTGKAPLN